MTEESPLYKPILLPEEFKGLEKGKIHHITARTGIGHSILVKDHSYIELKTINSVRREKGFKPLT